MKSTIYVVCSFLTLATMPGLETGVFAEEPREAAKEAIEDRSLSLATEIIELSSPKDRIEALFEQAIDQAIITHREKLQRRDSTKNPELAAILDMHLETFKEKANGTLKAHLETILDLWAIKLTETLTYDELINIKAFAETESGKRFLQLSTELSSNTDFTQIVDTLSRELKAIEGDFRKSWYTDYAKYLHERSAKTRGEVEE